MNPYFPKQISLKAIVVYLIALVFINLFYFNYSMSLGYIGLGCIWVIGFFSLVSLCSKRWKDLRNDQFVEELFLIAILLRISWVFISYFYYFRETGVPFEFEAVDSQGYHLDAEWMAGQRWPVIKEYLFGRFGHVSDSGYPLYLTIVYKIFGPNIIIARIIKALLSSWTCVLIYKLASKTFGEGAGRIAGLMAVFMPNLIIYCGYHLKETEMLFLEVAFLERTDYVFRSKKLDVWAIVLATLCATSLFLFRTVLGVVAVLTFATGALFSNILGMKKKGKRAAIIGWSIACVLSISGGTLATEIEGYWEERESNVEQKRAQQENRGNRWARYATGSVMAPIVIVLPFATMVEVDEQYNQLEKSGGNYVRNFMGFFALIAVYEAIRRKQWRCYITIGSFVIAYLGIVSLSGFSNSERFLLPGLPGLILLWSYGVATLREKTYKYLTPWCVVVFFMEFAWAYFKLGSRGLF